MNKVLLFLLFNCIPIVCDLQACVTYNPSNGSYTVDQSGCFNEEQASLVESSEKENNDIK